MIMNAKEWLMRANKIDKLINSVTVAKINREDRVTYLRELRKHRSEIFRIVRLIDDYESQCIIIERYINNRKWREISEILNYSTKWVKTKLHQRAVRKVEKILNENK
jgi:hypothetical protein